MKGKEFLGQTLAGKYHLAAVIGHGQETTVYHATEMRRHIPVAVKLYPSSADQDAVEQEAQTIASWDHPNLLRFLWLGEAEVDIIMEGTQHEDRFTPAREARKFLVTQLANSGTLADHRQRNGTLSLGEITDFVSQAAEGLYVIHQQGDVHRDLKPENLLLHKPEGTANLHMIVGDASSVIRAYRGDPTGTMQYTLSGTPEYSAPEHLEGKALSASDTFSLAVVTRQLFLGGKPDKTIRPIRRRLAAPPSVQELINIALSPDPEQRQIYFPRVIDFSTELAVLSEVTTQQDTNPTHIDLKNETIAEDEQQTRARLTRFKQQELVLLDQQRERENQFARQVSLANQGLGDRERAITQREQHIRDEETERILRQQREDAVHTEQAIAAKAALAEIQRETRGLTEQKETLNIDIAQLTDQRATLTASIEADTQRRNTEEAAAQQKQKIAEAHFEETRDVLARKEKAIEDRERMMTAREEFEKLLEDKIAHLDFAETPVFSVPQRLIQQKERDPRIPEEFDIFEADLQITFNDHRIADQKHDPYLLGMKLIGREGNTYAFKLDPEHTPYKRIEDPVATEKKHEIVSLCRKFGMNQLAMDMLTAEALTTSGVIDLARKYVKWAPRTNDKTITITKPSDLATNELIDEAGILRGQYEAFEYVLAELSSRLYPEATITTESGFLLRNHANLDAQTHEQTRIQIPKRGVDIVVDIRLFP
jgi:serine/threonine protein kinase